MEFAIDNIFRPLRNLFTRTVGYILFCESYIRALESEARWLKSQRDDVMKEVRLAERQGMEATNQVSHWLEAVASLLVRAIGIVAEFPRGGAAAGGLGLRAAYRLSKRADEARAEAVSLVEQRSTFQKVADAPVFACTEVLPTAAPSIGLDALLARVANAFQEGGTSVIGIYGAPGVGKTTLLHHFNNTFLSASAASMDIHLVIYVEVTERYSAGAVQKAIGGRLGLRWEDGKSTKEKALALCTYLHRWNFVLLLDDVWEPLNLAELGVPVPGRHGKSKVLLTTRLEHVCDQMDVTRKIKVECLSAADSWELFKNKVGNAFVTSREIQPLAQAMASRCGGLPLGLITVARAMACKRVTREWEHSMAVLNLAPWQLDGVEANLLVSLKRSYDSLRDDSLRICLLYCSLFSGETSKELLVESFIGEGFVSDVSADDMDDLYNKGHYMLGILVTSSLLEAAGDYHVTMHPMVRAMALWVVADCGRIDNKWLVRAGLVTSAAPRADKWTGAERVSLMRTGINELNDAPTCSVLKTLLLQSNRLLGRICHDFFSFMPCLRLLDLSDTLITALPSEINLLVTLQYLRLNNTTIRSLPAGIGALVNLRFLLLSNVPVQTIAAGVLNPLTALQVLCMDHCWSSWMDVGSCEPESGDSRKRRRHDLRQRVNLRELESLKSLQMLDISVQTLHSLEKLSQSPHLAEHLRNLHVQDCSDLPSIQFSPSSLWRHMSRLKGIIISGCCNLENVIITGGEYKGEQPWSLDRTVSMMRYRVPDKPLDVDSVYRPQTSQSLDMDCRKLVPLLPSLQSIILRKLPKAKIVWQGGSLEYLSSLSISSCSVLEHLISYDTEGLSHGSPAETVFPSLKELELHDLPNMRSIGPESIAVNFPSLASLKVVRCSRLKKLNLVAGCLKELQCTQTWWNKLVWENENLKTVFLSSVKPLA